MGELFEKLKKRREQVDEGGLHFESKPSERTADNHSGIGGAAGSDAANEKVFESQPSVQTADCRAEAPIARAATDAVPVNKRSSEAMTRRTTADFHSAIQRQRAVVDEGATTWTRSPDDAEAGAEKAKDAGAPPQEAEGERRARELAELMAQEEASQAEEKAKEEAEREAEQRAREEEAARQQAEAERQEAERLEAERLRAEEAARQEAERKAEEEAEQKAAEEAERASREEAEQQAQEEEETEEGDVSLVGSSRVNWRVGLRNFPRIEEFESPPFHLQGYGPITLRLHGVGPSCELSLHAEGSRPSGMRARLWVSKGWAKGKADKEWKDGDDMLTTFDVSLASRHSVLCGIVYHIP